MGWNDLKDRRDTPMYNKVVLIEQRKTREGMPTYGNEVDWGYVAMIGV